jgi:predicted nucleotidyltransferase component of viral defense system
MRLFDTLVNQAMGSNKDYAPLKVVVEKELIHHDILREMSRAGLLKHLTFMGGTCLRSCYGSNRLSEDLDFTGGFDYTRKTLSSLASVLKKQLHVKYDLDVDVGEPVKESGNVDTWKLTIITRPQQMHLPTQRVHIDICAIPSYDAQPKVLLNHYGVDMGTSGLIIQAQSRQEILADKMVAFALRLNRIKNRDLWDIGWLKQQNIILPTPLIWKKIRDHKQTDNKFLDLLSERIQLLTDDPNIQGNFIQEMSRFLPSHVVAETVKKDDFWKYLVGVVKDLATQILKSHKNNDMGIKFKM